MQPFTKRYTPKIIGGVDILQLFVNAKKDFGCPQTWDSICPWTSIVALLLSIFAVGGIIYMIKIVNPFAMAGVAAVVLIFFTIVGWFYWPLLALLGIVLVFGLFGRRGSE